MPKATVSFNGRIMELTKERLHSLRFTFYLLRFTLPVKDV